jgi:hypothetical protein
MSGSRKEVLERTNLLDIKPVRLADWEEIAGRIVVLRPEPVSHGLRRLLDRLLNLMSTPRIRLDRMGSHSWKHFDGEATVAEVAARLRDTFGEEIEPAEERLGVMVRTLHRERLLGFPGHDDEQSLVGASSARRVDETQ